MNYFNYLTSIASVKRSLRLVLCSIALVTTCASLSGCGLVKLHKINIQQGNLVTQKMIDKLKPGMTREQVIYIMGRPLVDSLFDDSAWHYIYTYSESRQTPSQRDITLYFDGDKLIRFEGYLKHSDAAEAPEVASADIGG